MPLMQYHPTMTQDLTNAVLPLEQQEIRRVDEGMSDSLLKLLMVSLVKT